MLTKDEINNILFFLNSATIGGNQAITMAVIQTKLSNLLKNIEDQEKLSKIEKEEEKVEEEIKTKEE